MIENIRNYYAPIQPTTAKSGTKVIYSELLPHRELLPYIYCYWELKTLEKLDTPFLYRVVTDGCIDIFFEMSNPRQSYVMGFCKKYTEFPLEQSFHYVGVRFLPTFFPQIFKTDASMLSNQYQALSNISDDAATFIKTTFNQVDAHLKISESFNQYFLDSIDIESFVLDDRLYRAINLILQNFGVVNLSSSIDTGISPRQLRRLFQYFIGDTPKSFSKVVQFQGVLSAKPSSQCLKQSKLFYDFGYYDQAHFIKDFKNFYGVTPNRAFDR